MPAGSLPFTAVTFPNRGRGDASRATTLYQLGDLGKLHRALWFALVQSGVF